MRSRSARATSAAMTKLHRKASTSFPEFSSDRLMREGASAAAMVLDVVEGKAVDRGQSDGVADDEPRGRVVVARDERPDLAVARRRARRGTPAGCVVVWTA